MKITLTCQGCGKEGLSRYPSQIYGAVFCNRECRNKNYKTVFPDWHPINYREHKCTCEKCGSGFIVHEAKIAKERRYCSRSCAAYVFTKGRKLPEATKVKLSVATANQNRTRQSQYPYDKNGKILYMRSSWEVAYAKYMDASGIEWTYEPSFKLKSGRVYMPDFQLNDGSIIEIKGYFREDALKKWNDFCAEYPSVKKQLLTKIELQELEII